MSYMDFSNMASVLGITVICYLAASGVKATNLNRKWIPFICGALGGVLGLIGMFSMPDYPAKDVINALAVGIVSGMAATGVNQACKQLKKKDL